MATGNRKAAEKRLYELMDKFDPTGSNRSIWEGIFTKMSDVKFDQFVKDLKSKVTKLFVEVPNLTKVKIDLQRNLALLKELGYDPFQRLVIPAENGLPSYLSPKKYMLLDLPLRRQAQLLVKKMSTSESNHSVDNFTNQPAGKSKSSSFTFPEVQTLAARGLNSALYEFMHIRGGDSKAFNASNLIIEREGDVSHEAIAPYAGEVKAKHTLYVYLTGAHLKNTLKT
jgi:hypothetical protein